MVEWLFALRPAWPGTGDDRSLLVSRQGWLNNRPLTEHDIVMTLFEESFPFILRYAVQNLSFKMDMLEAFVISQVRTAVKTNLKTHLFKQYFD